MENRALYIYVWATCLAAAVVAATLQWSTLAELSAADLQGLGALVGLGLVAEWQALSVNVGRNTSGSSIAFLPLLTIVLLFGPAATIVSLLFTTVVVGFGLRKKGTLRASFNIGQYTLAAALAAHTYSAAGGDPLQLSLETVTGWVIFGQLAPFVLFGVVLLVANNTLVAGAIALSQGLNFRDVWSKLVGPSGSHVLFDLLVAPIAIVMAILYVQIGVSGLLLAVAPLLFIRHSYQTNQQLQQANQDLLSALVKAIETRDPYTSGHSLRVSHLARRIAQGLGLGSTAVERIEKAALLHDVGKIEAAYTEILAKPGSLTQEERGIIQSHVTQGEELLRKLSSVPEDVILSVRHHHERPDGSGYPDGLVRNQIPLGARVIGVCDAIDAMLSDRPYRNALSVHTVIEQLLDNSGSQFDPDIVGVVLSRNLLGQYSDIVTATQTFSEREAPVVQGHGPAPSGLFSSFGRGAAGQRARRYLGRISS